MAGYYGPSGAFPAITGPGAPWTNEAQQSTAIDSFASSIGSMTGYQITTATGPEQYAGTVASAVNFGAFALSLKPSVSITVLTEALAAVSGTDSAGNSYPAGYMGKVTAIKPGSNPTTPEVWHSGTLLNSWAGSGSGVNGLWYRLLPWGPGGAVEIIADITNTTATGNSVCFTLPTGYIPATTQNHPAAINDFNTPVSIPWVNVATSGNVQITGIPVANKEIFFHIFVPLDTL